MKLSDIQVLSKFKTPFVYLNDPPMVVDSNNVPILELRGFTFLSSQFPDGSACEKQDMLGESLARTLGLHITVHSISDPQELYSAAMGTLQYLLSTEEKEALANAWPNTLRTEEEVVRVFKITPSEIILKRFSWTMTAGGYEYWESIHNRVQSTEENLVFYTHPINLPRGGRT